ncbi:caspase family protein [Chitinispirillales bacterium ANBcel5]|uniref:caspase family protein n=1 Tax=Cellulosispirillum alkaliphilum TaxID=3039283 RepID=UPI002A559E67|nr:caspase family protein [Chitinispirillales bacterium ANBcel5]
MKVAVWFLVIFCIAVSALENNRYAVLIGCNDGGAELSILNYAESDVKRFAEVLTGPGQFPSQNVVSLFAPDVSELQESITIIKEQIQTNGNFDDALFLFYYSGHSDGDHLLLGEEKYPLKKIKALLNESELAGVRIGIFDACYSGAVTGFKGGRRADPFFMDTKQKVKGLVLISSSAAHQRAQESETLKGSIFTHHWINGLSGSADLNGDRYVTLNEAYRYAYHKTIESSALTGGGVQHPSYHFNIQGEGEIRLTNLNKGTLSGILFDRSTQGSFLVLSPTYSDVYADFTKESGRELFVSLPPGEYSVINARTSEVFQRNMAVSHRNTTIITSRMLTEMPLIDRTRVKGPEQPGTEGSAQSNSLPSMRWGFGGGVLSHMGSGGQSDIVLSATGSYQLDADMDLFFNLNVQPFAKNAGLNAGVNVYSQINDFDVFAGVGPGLRYMSSGKDVAMSLRTHAGFSRVLGNNIEIQAMIPFIINFSRTGQFGTGIKMRFLFPGS